MSEFEQLKDIFETAEVLEDFGDSYLEVKTVNADDTAVVSIYFTFNEDNELVRVYTS